MGKNETLRGQHGAVTTCRLASQNGQTLLAAIGAMLVLAIIGYAVLNSFQNLRTMQNRQNFFNMLNERLGYFSGVPANFSAWTATSTDPRNPKCLSQFAQCAYISTSLFALNFSPVTDQVTLWLPGANNNMSNYNPLTGMYRDQIPNPSPYLLYDAQDGTAGLTLDGQICHGFNAQAGNPSCPLRIDVLYTLFQSGPANEILLKFQANYNPGPSSPIGPINIAKYVAYAAGGSSGSETIGCQGQPNDPGHTSPCTINSPGPPYWLCEFNQTTLQTSWVCGTIN